MVCGIGKDDIPVPHRKGNLRQKGASKKQWKKESRQHLELAKRDLKNVGGGSGGELEQEKYSKSLQRNLKWLSQGETSLPGRAETSRSIPKLWHSLSQKGKKSSP